LIVSFLNLLIILVISCKRHNQNKTDATMNKNQGLLNLLVQSWIY